MVNKPRQKIPINGPPRTPAKDITVCWNKNVKDSYRGPAPFHRLTPNKRFEPVFSTVIMAVCSLFNIMLFLTDLIPVHLVYCGQTVMIGCNHTSFEWTRAVRHIYGIIRHMQGLYTFFLLSVISTGKPIPIKSMACVVKSLGYYDLCMTCIFLHAHKTTHLMKKHYARHG